MRLRLQYRGGAVVYLNGEEVVRGHLPPAGEVGPLVLAADYPRDAFVEPDGETTLRDYGRR